MPSSSARCSQLPRASDKVPFFVALRKLRDHVCGRLPRPLDESEVVFPDLDLKVEPRRDRRPLPAPTSTTAEPADRKRHFRDDEEGPPGLASTQTCDVPASLPLWHSPHTSLPNWSSYPSFNPSLPECAYGSRKFREGPPPYGSCMPSTCMPFGWNTEASSRWSSDYPSSHIRHPSLDRALVPEAGSALIPRPGYGTLPPYPYSSSGSILRSGASLLPECGPMMNSSRSPAVLDMLTPGSTLLHPYPQ